LQDGAKQPGNENSELHINLGEKEIHETLVINPRQNSNEVQVENTERIENGPHLIAPNIEKINRPTLIRSVTSRTREPSNRSDESTSTQATVEDQPSIRSCSTPLSSKETSGTSQTQVNM